MKEDAEVIQAAADGHPDLGAYPVTTEPEEEDGQVRRGEGKGRGGISDTTLILQPHTPL